jgi:hypothetical protein
MELRPIPFIGATRYRIDLDGRVFAMRAAPNRRRAPRPEPVTAMSRQAAEDASRRILGGRRDPAKHFGLVAPAWSPPAGERPMVWCLTHTPGNELAWGGAFIDAFGDTEEGWYVLSLGARGTAILHGPSIAAEIRKSVTKGR